MTKLMAAGILTALLGLPVILSPTLSLAEVTGESPPQRAIDVNMAAMSKLTPDGVRKIQLALQKRGINPGPIDGIFGRLTKEAVRTFQDHYGITASGDVDNQTLFALGEPDLAT